MGPFTYLLEWYCNSFYFIYSLFVMSINILWLNETLEFSNFPSSENKKKCRTKSAYILPHSFLDTRIFSGSQINNVINTVCERDINNGCFLLKTAEKCVSSHICFIWNGDLQGYLFLSQVDDKLKPCNPFFWWQASTCITALDNLVRGKTLLYRCQF